MKPFSFLPRGDVGTWSALRLFLDLIVVPVISVSLVSSLGSGSSSLVGYGQPALLAYLLTALTLILHGSLKRLYRVSRVINIRRCNPDPQLLIALRLAHISGELAFPVSRPARTSLVCLNLHSSLANQFVKDLRQTNTPL